MDRNDVAAAAGVFERLYPDSEERHRAGAWLARSVREAADANPSNWALSLFEREVRLNVGKGQVLTLAPGMVLAMVDAPKLSRKVREELWGMLELPSREFEAPGSSTRGGQFDGFVLFKHGSVKFTSVGDEKGLARINVHVLEQVEPMLAEAHVAFIRKASETAETSPFRRSHAPGLLQYLRRLLDDGFLPDPQPATPRRKRK